MTTLISPRYLRVLTFFTLFIGLTISTYAQRTPVPWGCTGDSYLFQNLPTDIFKVNLLTGESVSIFQDLAGTTATGFVGINGVGFNQKDNFIWGFKNNTSQVARIHADGFVDYYTIPSMPAFAGNVGDVDAAGQYYFTTATGQTMYKIDLDPASSNYLGAPTVIPLSIAVDVRDWAFKEADFFPLKC